MAEIDFPFGAAAERRLPTLLELSDGFPCGPADIELFNWLHWWQSGQSSQIARSAGESPSADDITQLARLIRSQRANYVAASGTPDALTVILPVSPNDPAEMAGMPLRVAVSATNTGPTTLQVGDLPAQPIVRADNGGPLLGRDWQAGAVLDLLNDGSAWRLVSPQARNKPPALLFYGCL